VTTETSDTAAAGTTLSGGSSDGEPRRQRPGPARRLALAASGLIAVVVFQLLFASVFLGVLHHPTVHHAPVAVAGTSPLGAVVSRHGGGTIRLVPESTARAAQAAIRDGQGTRRSWPAATGTGW